MQFLGGKGGYFQKLSYGSETFDMTSEGLGEMFEGDLVDMCANKDLHLRHWKFCIISISIIIKSNKSSVLYIQPNCNALFSL